MFPILPQCDKFLIIVFPMYFKGLLNPLPATWPMHTKINCVAALDALSPVFERFISAMQSAHVALQDKQAKHVRFPRIGITRTCDYALTLMSESSDPIGDNAKESEKNRNEKSRADAAFFIGSGISCDRSS
ncbi:hypothetical protein [Paraburkholderia sp.]|uniref:hypothetical protein n=1 Tax=Paraburkholderia sp. TaxID=1926495 RepID=UPI0023A02BC6|nr:hypothetical protein [Paraburkholderia sp.]MDE1184159.1 hypothetical protein [Paraburkholderia sp.]